MARTQASDHAAKRAQILRVAARVFATHGYHGASMAQVAAGCGISKGNIYHYYSGKDALLFDVLESYLKGLRDRIMGLDLTWMGAEEGFRRLIFEVLRAYQGSDNEHRVQISALDQLPRAGSAVLRGYQRDLVAKMSVALSSARPEVFYQDNARLRAATMSVFGMLNWYFMWNSGAGAAARDAYAGLVADLTLGGVGAIGQPPAAPGQA